jgi:glycosyltransferase involved in cell wall biosynthesis
MSDFSVSVIIPAFNEEAIIETSVNQALQILKCHSADFEVIIVNDCSSDRTREILDSKFSQFKEISIIHKVKNEGFGSAIRTGISNSTKEFLFCVPVDSPLTTDLFLSFRENSNKADVLVSYRKKRLGYSTLMLFNSWLYHLIISILFGLRLKDYNWIHLYNRKIFDQGEIKIDYNGIFMLAEILIKAKQKGYTFYEFEVIQTQRLTGIATSAKPSVVFQTFMDMLVFRLKLKES